MTRTDPLTRVLFAVLVLATFAAFFVAQRLKSTPPVIQDLGVTPFFSPNGDGRFDRARVSFTLKRADVVDLAVVNTQGDVVRELLQGADVAVGERARAVWDGRDDAGRRVRDGTYRARLVLRQQGRTATLPRNILLDTAPPEPRVLSIGPSPAGGPELLPTRDGAPATIRFRAPGRRPSAEIWRTDRPQPRRVTGLTIERVRNGIGRTSWDGTRAGRRVSPGIYVVVVRSRDRAGNIGQSVPDRVLRGHPRRGERLPGKAGITVRYLAVQPPLLPVGAGRPFTVAVDARGQTYNWDLRRAGAPQPVRRSRRAQGGPFTRDAPNGRSGLFLFEVRTRNRSARVPVAVDDRRTNQVLVVLPATTWQGRNAVDDDGDGLPNTLDLGVPVRLERVFAGDGLPAGLATNEAPLLAALDRAGHRYDLTTDVALAAGRGPRIDGHRGVLLAGDAVWLTQDVRRGLRRFVAAGGTVASFGTGSLRRSVTQTPQQLLDPSPQAREDLFGARLAPVRRKAVTITVFVDDKNLQLFAGGGGQFTGVDAWEATTGVGAEAKLLSSAATPDGRPVIVAARFGSGLVLRPGIADFPTRLSSDPQSAELLGRIWTLLRTA